jgi:hypothetical protein
MSGFLRRIRTARPSAPDDGAARSGEGGSVHAHDEPASDGGLPPLPAGTDLDALVGDRPSTQRRGRLRRRLRHLRRVREALLRDLGGMVFEIHRSGQAGAEAQSRLVGAKLARLDAVNGELHELEEILDDRRGMVMREPGIGGTCPLCGELHGSDARFCWACGTPVAPGAVRPVTATSAQALPQIGAAAHEGEPRHIWTAQPRAAAPEAATTEQPHIDAESEELGPGEPVEERRR